MNRTQLRDACAASSYTLTLLLQGYKFNHTTWLNIHFVRQVGKCPAAPVIHALCREIAHTDLAPAPGWGAGDKGATRSLPCPGQLLSSARRRLLGHLAWAFMLSPSLSH